MGTEDADGDEDAAGNPFRLLQTAGNTSLSAK